MALAKFFRTGKRRARAVAATHAVGAGGFSLLEVLFATSLLTVAVVALAQLFVVSTRANTSARATTFAAIFAQQKMEQLRGLTWGFDALGLPLTDTSSNTTAAAQTATGGLGLTPSPTNTLKANFDGYCDYLDRNGASLGGGTAVPAGAIYIRRWSIEPLPTNPNNTLVLQVLVTPNRERGSAELTTNVGRLPDEARIVSVKTRKAS
jgi:type II secretory pathway pseudopilin PulG